MKGYLCMCYRGPFGDDASTVDVKNNIQRAVMIGGEIRKHFPSIKLFIPHENQELLHLMWKEELTSSDEILAGCLLMVDQMDFLIVIGTVSDGMALEIDRANDKGVPVFKWDMYNDNTREELALCLSRLREHISMGA